MKTLLTISVALFSLTLIAQPEKKSVVIGSITTKPNALLIVNPQHSDQGVLLPQLSTHQRLSMKPSSPSEDGLIVYDTDVKSYFYWSQNVWMKLRALDSNKPGYYNIDPISFHELKPDGIVRHTNMVIFETDNTFVTASRNGQGEGIIAPVNLPHGAIMKEITVSYMDNDDDNFRLQLLRKTLSGVSEQIIAWESAGLSATVTSASLANFNGKERIDLESYSYRVVVTFDIDDGQEVLKPSDATQRLYGVRIKFEE